MGCLVVVGCHRQTMSLPESIIHLFRTLTTAEAGMVAVERLNSLAEVESEQAVLSETRAGHSRSSSATASTSCGHVELKRLKLRYRVGAEAALDSTTLDVPAGCKLAVVGRSGAGKVCDVYPLCVCCCV